MRGAKPRTFGSGWVGADGDWASGSCSPNPNRQPRTYVLVRSECLDEDVDVEIYDDAKIVRGQLGRER